MSAIPFLTVIHVTAGSLALLAGAGAMNFRKGSRRHRQAGSVFFVAMLVMAALGATLAAFDVRLIVRGGISGAKRVVRHLWLIGFAFFIATGSLFLWQPQVFPEPLKPVALRAVPVLLVVGLTVFWLIRVSFTRWYGKRMKQDEPGIRQGIGWGGRRGAAGAPGQPAP